jgi:predicted secreted protein
MMIKKLPAFNGAVLQPLIFAAILLAVCLPLAGLLGACKTAPAESIPVESAEAVSTVTLTFKGNPTTGYTWTSTMKDQGIVREVSRVYVLDQGDSGLVGQGGAFEYTYEAVADGETEIRFIYSRPWEKGVEPVSAETYTFTVKKGALSARRK